MSRPRVYFVDGTALAEEGDHVFKEVVAGYGPVIDRLKSVADIVELVPDKDNLYYLQSEGCDADYGENYLVASQGLSAGGRKGQGGSICSILSPRKSYNEYVENIQAIKSLLELKLDVGLNNKLLRLLFIGVCGELEGYLSSTIIALIQGVREVFLSLRGYEESLKQPEEHRWRDEFVEKLNDEYQFLKIRCRGSKERRIYEQLLDCEIKIPPELFDEIKWRNKMAHRVPFDSKPVYPEKGDVLAFIEHANCLVDYIDKKITKYKSNWLEEL